MSLDARQERKRKAIFDSALEDWQARSATDTAQSIGRGLGAASRTRQGMNLAMKDVRSSFKESENERKVAKTDPDMELANFYGGWSQAIDEAFAPDEKRPDYGEDARARRLPGSAGTGNARSVRNNNPGNIRTGGDAWQGALEGMPKDEEFVTFESPEMGVRAMARTLNTYKTKYELDTISKIINRWAPSSENDTKSYIKTVSEKTGIPSNKKIGFDVNSEEMKKLISAMIEVEGGQEAADYFSSTIINKGISLAGFDNEV